MLRLLATGKTAARLGREMRISERTVHKHLENLYAKLGVHDRLAAVLQAQDLGLLELRRSRPELASRPAGRMAAAPDRRPPQHRWTR